LNVGGGGGGEGDAGGGAESCADLTELAVVGAKIMPPMADAVGFVDGKEGDLGVFDAVHEAGHSESFRS